MNEFRLSPGYLTRQEIRRRPCQFLLSVLAVAAGVAAVLGVLSSLRSERQKAEALLQEEQDELDRRYAAYQEELAAAMTKAGFQVVILPREQNLADWHNADFAAKRLPADAVERLCAKPLDTLEHLLPRLTGRLDWPERRWTVIVYGTADEVLYPTSLGQRWLDRAVPAGQVDVGHEIATAFGLAPGQELAVAGHVFRIRQCRASAGAKDDIALHFALADAQTVLDRQGEVNEILALQRREAWGDADRIRAEITGRLPEAQAVEIGNRVVANARARRMAEQESANLLAQSRERQEKLFLAQARLGSALAAGAIGLSALWLAVLTILNLARRRAEIGLLAALGLPIARIRAVFLGRVFLAAVVGLAAGAVFWLPSLTAGSLLAAVAAALPAPLAAAAIIHGQIRRDPADALRNDC
jgi:ABC-type antimicrobial peptide transport system permease subunit